MYPPTEPYDRGMLHVGEGNRVYWEVCGNPRGSPAVVLHGGPGSGCTPEHRRLFDPAAYRIVLFDQRQCGRSTPHASEPATSLATNTTWRLVADIEALRRALGVERWLVYGNSWGSTLALAYAEEHPEQVSAVVLAAVTTTTREEVDWLYRGAGRVYPAAWEDFRAGGDGDGDLVAAYARRLATGEDEEAARRWCAWEEAVVGLGPQERYRDPRFRMAFARIVTHYFSHGAWLEEGVLIKRTDRLQGLPGVLVHGRQDVGSPLSIAQRLVAAWPGADLVVVETDGHAGAGMSAAVVAATDRLRSATAG